MKLPFIEPDENLHLNLGIIILLLMQLGKSSRGTLKLNNDRLHIYYFLVKSPVKLNLVANFVGKESSSLSHEESFSVSAISSNVEPLFNREKLRALLSILISEGIAKVQYKKGDGFLYFLTDKGEEIAKSLRGEYFEEINLYCESLKSTLGLTVGNLNIALGKIMRMETL